MQDPGSLSFHFLSPAQLSALCSTSLQRRMAPAPSPVWGLFCCHTFLSAFILFGVLLAAALWIWATAHQVWGGGYISKYCHATHSQHLSIILWNCWGIIFLGLVCLTLHICAVVERLLMAFGFLSLSVISKTDWPPALCCAPQPPLHHPCVFCLLTQRFGTFLRGGE